MTIDDTLQSFGLNEHESAVYLAALELGESTVLPIAKKAGIKRTYCYDILADLQKKQLISFFEKNNRRRYVAEKPEKIEEILHEKLKNFKNILPELKSIYNRAPEKPKIRYFDGENGIISIYEMLLKTKEFDAIASPADIYKRIGEYFNEYEKKQRQRNIKIRELITADGVEAEYIKAYQKPRQEARVLPENVKIATDMIIFENKLAMISYVGEMHAVLIESSAIIETQKALFEIIWAGASRL